MRCGLRDILRFSSPSHIFGLLVEIAFGTLGIISKCFFNICALRTGNIDARIGPHVHVQSVNRRARSKQASKARSQLEPFCLFIHLYYKSACSTLREEGVAL